VSLQDGHEDQQFQRSASDEVQTQGYGAEDAGYGVPRSWDEQEELQDGQLDEEIEEEQWQSDPETGYQDRADIDTPEEARCLICWDSVTGLPWDKFLSLDCGDIYCLDCLNKALGFALACEANFPLRCGCKQQ